MRTCLLSIILTQLVLLKTIFSYDLEEIKIKLENMGLQRKQLSFLEEPLTYDEHEDQNLSFEQIVIRKGYPLSSYFVNTEDGYILKMYRISGAKNSTFDEKEEQGKKAVLLQHGLVDSCDSWVANHETKSLAFILANLGYDVWLGNNRGNKHSRAHLKFNPDKDKEFWNYSFHEMGLYDLPAMIKHIQKTKNSDGKITYIGHSQGTSQLFAGMTLLPEFFESKLNGFLALGPVTNLKFVNSTFLKYMVDFRLDLFFSKLGINEMFRNTESVTYIEKILCTNIGVLCQGILQIISDFDLKDDDLDRFIVFLAHFPSGSSVKTFLHFAQSIRYKSFASLNDMVPYDFSKAAKFPVALFVGMEDRLATVPDNRDLKVILEQNNLLNFYREYEDTGHVSFFISMSNIFMNDVVQKVKEFSS